MIGGGAPVPGNDLQRLPLGFDSPRLHHILRWKVADHLPGNRPSNSHNKGQRPRQEHPMWQAEAIA